MMAINVPIRSGYRIQIDNGLLAQPAWQQSLNAIAQPKVIITDHCVKTLYADALGIAIDAKVLSFPAGEQSKTRETKAHLEDQLLQQHYGRDTVIIAVGGGIVTDMAGFVAATYCRGVDLISIPTTLLAMVDAAVGGKTAVNTPLGKNLIGAFKQPRAVYIDPNVLNTQSEAQRVDGIIETLKHGLISDADLLNQLERLPRTTASVELSKLIYSSIMVKRNIVCQDEKERGLRAILNLGHTIAHALETSLDHRISHGQAVLHGIVIEAKIAVDLGIMQPVTLDQIIIYYRQWRQVKLNLNNAKIEKIVQRLKLDKKNQHGQIHMVLLESIGKTYTENGKHTVAVEVNHIKAAIAWFNTLEQQDADTDIEL